jgi:hypothetical protein
MSGRYSRGSTNRRGSSKYIYVIKKRKLEHADKRKTRLVVLGCGQCPGIDFSETFASVEKAALIRILFALAQAYKLHIHQMDVDNGFSALPGDQHQTRHCMLSRCCVVLSIAPCRCALRLLYDVRRTLDYNIK